MAKTVQPQQPPEPPAARRLQAGDEITLRARVVSTGPGDAVTVEFGPADVPGSEGYVQTVTLHHAALCGGND